MLALQQSLRATICESAPLAHGLTKPFAERSVLSPIEASVARTPVLRRRASAHCCLEEHTAHTHRSSPRRGSTRRKTSFRASPQRRSRTAAQRFTAALAETATRRNARRNAMASAKRPMPVGPRGGKLDFDYLTRKAHNPGRRKKQREFYKNAKLIRSYEKLRKRDGDVGTERDFTKPQKRARAEAEAKGEPAPKREKRRKRDPFAKVRAARDAAAAERQQRRDDAEAAKKKALERRKKKAAQMRSAPGRLRGQLDDVLAKLEGERR